LIPDHILSRATLDPDPAIEQDRRAFQVISRRATRACVLSRSRRNAQGGLLSPSPLVPQGVRGLTLKRTRIPQHAFSGADRVLARPDEAAASSVVSAPVACWANWKKSAATAYDGLTRADHPTIVRAIDEVQSATSLRLMLRDPLAFVWRYALGWRSIPEDDQPLTLDERAYGELVHELLKRTVDALEPNPGYARASRHEIELALASATAYAGSHWPVERRVPPAILWQHTLDAAAGLAFKAVTVDEAFQPGTRSWTELAFGQVDGSRPTVDTPWPPDAPVVITGTQVRVRGNIDRLDLTFDGRAVRVSDYKTGAEPRQPEQVVLGGGAELQRVIYALPARQFLPGNPRVIARLVYLGQNEPKSYKLPDVDQSIMELAAHVSTARELLRRGVCFPARQTVGPLQSSSLTGV
jgi:RecB family exonuclease